MIEVKEMLRLWLEGRSLREVTPLAGVDRKTVRRYVQAAQAAGLVRDGDAGQLTDELLGVVVGVVRPARPQATGAAWQTIAGQREQISQWLAQDLTLAKVHLLLGRHGVVVPYRTLHRFATAELGFGRRRRATVRMADGKPGDELQVDFGRLGLIPDPARGSRRVVHALVFTAVYSRHLFVYPTHRQSLEQVIAGFEAAWAFFGASLRSLFRTISRPSWTTPTRLTRGSTTRFANMPRPGASRWTRPGCAILETSPESSAACTMCSPTSSPVNNSATWLIARRGPLPGVPRSPGSASTALPVAARWKSSPLKNNRCCCPPPPSRLPSRSTPGPRWPQTDTWKSPAPCIPCPAT